MDGQVAALVTFRRARVARVERNQSGTKPSVLVRVASQIGSQLDGFGGIFVDSCCTPVALGFDLISSGLKELSRTLVSGGCSEVSLAGIAERVGR